MNSVLPCEHYCVEFSSGVAFGGNSFVHGETNHKIKGKKFTLV